MGIDVVIVDDQDIIRLGVRQSLDDIPHITFLGGYSDVSSFCQSATVQRADVVLLDDSLPDMDLVQAYETVQEQCPNAAVLVLGTQMSAHDIHRVIGGGALGVVCKNEPVQDALVVGIRRAYEGQVYLSSSAALIAGRLEPALVLSPRLDQVLHLMARGGHVQGMAQALGITDKAVYNARTRLREILEVDTNEQIVAEAMRRGLLRRDD